MRTKSTLLLISLWLFVTAGAQDFKSLTPTPPMGWNSWNYFGKNDINETIIRECIDAIVESGLKDAGYEYVVVDGGWRDTELDADGRLKSHPVKFPHGIKPLVDYAHSKGLKFGVHTVPGTHDCGGDKVGAYNIEEVHINQFIEWGLDFIKVDKCKLDLDCEANCWTEEKTEEVYRKWRKILDEKKSTMVLSISAYKFRDWNSEVCNMSRTTGDISARVSGGAFFTHKSGDKPSDYAPRSVMGIAHKNNLCADFAGSGYWNDPDMLANGDNGLSVAEQESHFALWCVMSAPLFLGNDPRYMLDSDKKIITNKLAIAIDQDPTEQGRYIYSENAVEVWKKNLDNGKSAILIINAGEEAVTNFSPKLEQLGIEDGAKVQDVYSGEKYKLRGTTEFSLKPGACKFILVN
ncbi:glycoside hydrolase family 27 protein [Maribellus sediminis]|uniref:glycoside hydrolase family 27 protein n=1 Tax=Maribellus sediminis TaxID=2696285 RepID=UPI0014309140|nr:glycoside hydrolase family 27 protein [Maribellus sediminis]